MNLLEAQLRHHAADVLLIEVLAESRVAADAFQDLSTVTELDEIHVGGLVRHLVVAQNLLLGIVGYHEETVVLAHQLDVGTVQPERAALSDSLCSPQSKVSNGGSHRR